MRLTYVADAVEQNKFDLSEVIGLQLGELLGCGSFGCVYATESRWVAKVTEDPYETKMWRRIFKLYDELGEAPAGVPKIKEIVKLSPGRVEAWVGGDLWLIVREGIIPLVDEDYKYSRGTHQIIQSGEDPTARKLAIDHFTQALRDLHRLIHNKDPDLVREALFKLNRWPSKKLYELLYVLYHEGFKHADCHLKNVGWNDKEQIVFYDPTAFGYGELPEYPSRKAVVRPNRHLGSQTDLRR